ncbi:hypothetical protein [Nitrosopumilus spindle-shaped virus]|uniref:Uncharacterized protein n=1 Tax=Nitrosopumilus spindle-shaped virus TaxID=2508184 RepID=A0A514K320_9VIRU|nr:hypothetical protein [Nitrosopumilus spindle-shaped virus]
MKLESYNSKVKTLEKKLLRLKNFKCRTETEVKEFHKFHNDGNLTYCLRCGINRE